VHPRHNSSFSSASLTPRWIAIFLPPAREKERDFRDQPPGEYGGLASSSHRGRHHRPFLEQITGGPFFPLFSNCCHLAQASLSLGLSILITKRRLSPPLIISVPGRRVQCPSPLHASTLSLCRTGLIPFFFFFELPSPSYLISEWASPVISVFLPFSAPTKERVCLGSRRVSFPSVSP